MRCLAEIVYLELKDRVQLVGKNTGGDHVCVSVADVAGVYTKNAVLRDKIRNIALYRFGDGEKRQIIGQLRVTKEIEEQVGGCMLIPVGETDCIVECINPKWKDGKNRGWQNVKIGFVSLLCMFGGAFSVMAFHNDISITELFAQIYEYVTGRPSGGCTILEISYSFGLLAGILIFYNHIGKRRITSDPTPVEVSMRSYEADMNEALVKAWEREGKKIDVD